MTNAGHSISRRLSLQLAALAFAGFGVLSAGIYCSVAALIMEKQATHESSAMSIIDGMVRAAAVKGSEEEVLMQDAVLCAAPAGLAP